MYYISNKSITNVNSHHIKVPTPEDLCRHLFLTFVNQPAASQQVVMVIVMVMVMVMNNHHHHQMTMLMTMTKNGSDSESQARNIDNLPHGLLSLAGQIDYDYHNFHDYCDDYDTFHE